MRIRFLSREMPFLFALLIVASSNGENASTLQFEREIPFAGVEGRIDHFSVDVPGQRLFVAALGNGSVLTEDLVGCRFPARLVVLDTDSGRIVATLATVGDSDDIFYDSDRKLVYVIGGEGAVQVLGQSDPNSYLQVGRITTASGARTGLFVSALNPLFVAVPLRGSDSAKVLIYRAANDK